MKLTETLYGWSAWKGHLERWKEYCSEASTSGFDYVELSLDYPLPTDIDLLKKAVDVARDSGLRVSFHAPWRGLDLASPWEEVRAGVLKLMEKVAELASRFEVEYVVLHLTTSEKLTPDVRDAVMRAGKESAKRIAELAKASGVPMLIETVGKLSHPDYFGEIRDETEAEFCFDVTHAVSAFMSRHKLDLDEVNVDEVIELWKNALGDRAPCVHLHGIEKGERGRYKTHQTLVYPITKRVAAKAIATMNATWATLEVYYSKGKELGPRAVAKEMEEVKSWERVYRRS